MKNMTFGTRLSAFVVAICVTVGTIAWSGVWRGNAILEQGQREIEMVSGLARASTEWQGLTLTNATRSQAIFLSDGNAMEEAYKDSGAATTARISELQAEIERMSLTPSDQAQMQRIAQMRKQMIDVRTKLRDLRECQNFCV